MSDFISNGQRLDDGGLNVTNFVDDPSLRLKHGEDYRPRGSRTWIRQVVLHTTKGIPGGGDDRAQDIRTGLGPSSRAGNRVVNWWTRDGRQAGAHLVVDYDGAVYQCADLQKDATFHAGMANEYSIGVEVAQGSDAELYEGQLEATVLLCDWLTRTFGIQRMIPHRYLGPVRRLMTDLSDVVGVLGHRDLSNRRGSGDPGSKIMNMLGAAGYEPVDYSIAEDRDLFRRRQREHKIDPADGVAGPATIRAFLAAGIPHGVWVRRPGDDVLPQPVA